MKILVFTNFQNYSETNNVRIIPSHAFEQDEELDKVCESNRKKPSLNLPG